MRGPAASTARVQHHHLVADPLDITQEVGREQEAPSRALREDAKERDHRLASSRVEAGGRFIQDAQRRVVHERLGKLHPLAHPDRVFLDLAVALLVQPDELQNLVGAAECEVLGKSADLPHVATKPIPVISGIRQSCSGMYPTRSRMASPSPRVSCSNTQA